MRNTNKLHVFIWRGSQVVKDMHMMRGMENYDFLINVFISLIILVILFIYLFT